MGFIFNILFGFVPVIIVGSILVTIAILNAKKNKENLNNDEFKDIYDKIERETKELDKEILTDEDIEKELVRRYNSLSNQTNVVATESQHDETCHEDSCDGCGSQDVYDQVYGKRKKNKLKAKK